MTLVELMVSVFLFTLFTGSTYFSLDIARRAGRSGSVEIELQENARKAMVEMLKDLRETDPSTVTPPHQYTDPQNGEVHQAVAFASARGDVLSAVEGGCTIDEVPNNACFHVDGTGNPRWRSLIVYAPYQTSDGRMELRRYVSFNSSYGSGNYFPFTFTGITATQLNLRSAGGVNISLARNPASGTAVRTLMENMATEDADNDNTLDTIENDGSATLPVDNADDILNRGADFALNGRILTTTLFLRKREAPFSTASQFVVSTLTSSGEMRN